MVFEVCCLDFDVFIVRSLRGGEFFSRKMHVEQGLRHLDEILLGNSGFLFSRGLPSHVATLPLQHQNLDLVRLNMQTYFEADDIS